MLRDGFQYELIATTLTAEAWPAEAVAALFFGRATMENAFAQEDREYGTDRTASYRAPGQAWVTVIAQLLSNAATLDGVQAHPLPGKVAAQSPRSLPDPAPPATKAEFVPEPERVEMPAPPAAPESAATPEPAATTSRPSKAEAHATLWGVIEPIFVDIAAEPGWVLDRGKQEVRCPAGWIAAASGLGSERHNRRPSLHLRVPTEKCRTCPMRLDCMRSTNPARGKRVSRSLAPDLVDHVQQAIDVLHRPDALRPMPGRDYEVKNTTRPTTETLSPGPWIPDSPKFLPASARGLAREAVLHSDLVCHIVRADARPPQRHPLIAASGAERQHRRQSWAERHDRWKSPYEATLFTIRRR